jgi:hypothetical protein
MEKMRSPVSQPLRVCRGLMSSKVHLVDTDGQATSLMAFRFVPWLTPGLISSRILLWPVEFSYNGASPLPQ